MTTSGTFSFSVGRDEIIKVALQFLGKFSDSELPTTTETNDLSRLLNMMVKQWMGKSDFAPGLKTWTRRLGYLWLSPTTGVYSVGPTATGWTNSYVNPNTTATYAAGTSSIVVTSATGIAANYYIGLHQNNGVIFWTTVGSGYVSGTTIPLTANTTYASSTGSEVYVYQTIAQQPQLIETAILRDQFNSDTPLKILTVQDYDNLPNKVDPTNISDPSAIYYEYQLGNSNLSIDCGAANDTNKYIVLRYLEAIQDFNNPLDTPEYPQEWFLALGWGLAAQAASIFMVPWEQSMEARYKEALRIAQNKGAEISSLFFQTGAED